MAEPQFHLGLCFPDANTFRAAVRQHSVLHGRDIRLKKNDKDKIQAICKHETCPWIVYASKMGKEATLQVKSLHAVHECTRKERVGCATSKWLADKYNDKLRTDPKWPIQSMMTVVQKECKLLFSKHQLWRAKRRVKNMNSGSNLE